MRKNPHIHRYEFAMIGKRGSHKVYRCTLPSCMHYLHAFNAPPTLNTLCSQCNREIIVDTKSLEKIKPICKACLFFESGSRESEIELESPAE